MSPEIGLLLASLALIFGNAFFVAAEYALVAARRARIEPMVRRGNRTAKILLGAMDDMSSYVAGVQIAITMLSLAIGLVAEPFFSEVIKRTISSMTGRELPLALARSVAVISLVLITFLTVVFGELVPKYLSLQAAERIALLTIRPLRLLIRVLSPLVWLVERSGELVLRPFGVQIGRGDGDAVGKDELLMMIRTGGLEGTLEKTHAELVSRALRLDSLDARDIMIHRLDIKWIDIDTGRDQLLDKLARAPYTRLPVCRGDIDEVAGILYLHDVVRHIRDPAFSLASIVRSPVLIPENLSLEKIVGAMREEKTQMLIVMDEYGGTSGLVTLEDVVEEVFGELEDRLESERPPIELLPGGRISARADVRYDELVIKLALNVDPSDNTDTLAQIMVDHLGRVPRPGDASETALGVMRVENMARRRITRVSLQLADEFTRELAGTDPS